jgi:nucleoside phosphorylase
MVLIVIASMEQELAGLRKQLRRGWRPGGGSLRDSKGTLSLDLRVIGMGKQAGVKLRSMLENSNGLSSRGLNWPPSLLLLGVAGAVGPDLETGDLVLSSRYYRPLLDENPPFTTLEREARDLANPDEIPETAQDKPEAKTDFLAPDPRLWQWAIAAGRNMDKPVVYADSLTVSHLVTAPKGKLAIGRRYPVGIVNMEDYWAASVAQEAGVPFISARAILDPAQQALPGYLPGIVGSRAKASLSLMAMPWRVPTLVGLARQLGIAQRALTDFALNFLTQVSDATSTLSYEAAFGALPAPDRSVP